MAEEGRGKLRKSILNSKHFRVSVSESETAKFNLDTIREV